MNNTGGLVKKIVKGLIIAGLVFFISILLFVTWVIAQFPNDQEIRGCLTTQMYHVHLCPGSHEYVPLQNISPFLQKAVVLTEDSTFWTHHGFDFEEMQRSLQRNYQKGKFVRGGSTISQQLAKNMFLTEEKTLLRKAKEAIITLRLEKVLNKKEILERYLNVVHLGKNIFGVKQAAQFYFQKSPAELNVVEAAFLTFLLPSPEKYSVSFSHGQLTPFAHRRLQQIIGNLHQYERISDEDYEQAKITLAGFLNKDAIAAPIDNPDEQEEPAEPEDD